MSIGAATPLHMPARAVVDSVIISALHRGGNPAKILELAQQGEVEIYLSFFILDEVAGILRTKLLWADERIKGALTVLPCRIIDPGRQKLNIVHDEADNRILECAIAADAVYLITGDKQLLDLKRYRRIHILTPGAFLSRRDF